MIFSSIKTAIDLSIYPQVIRTAIHYLKETDFMKLQPGLYEIEGKDIFAKVIDLQTATKENQKPEVHRKYIDVQFLVEGKELIGVAADDGTNEVDKELLEEKDIIFYKKIKDETYLKMRPGNFAIFFPEDVHMPGCCDGECSKIRKVIVKINTEML